MQDQSNDEQSDYWSGANGISWITYEESQDDLLSSVSDLVIRKANLRPGEAVVDIGCGTGAVTLAAAEKVGSQGRVVATDISPPLLDRTAQRTRNLMQVSTLLGDSQNMVWPQPPFDVAVSRFGVMFFSDPPAAFLNISRALRPGGRIVFAAWASIAENPYWQIAGDCAVARMGSVKGTPENEPGPFGLADPNLARERLVESGLSDVQVSPTSVNLTHTNGMKGLAEQAIRIGPAGRIIRSFDGTEEDMAAIAEDIEVKYAQYAGASSKSLPARINLITAKVTN